MRVIFNSVKMELKKELTPTVATFVKAMAKKGFLMTYYQAEDTHFNKEGGSIKELSIKLKEINTIKI